MMGEYTNTCKPCSLLIQTEFGLGVQACVLQLMHKGCTSALAFFNLSYKVPGEIHGIGQTLSYQICDQLGFMISINYRTDHNVCRGLYTATGVLGLIMEYIIPSLPEF